VQRYWGDDERQWGRRKEEIRRGRVGGKGWEGGKEEGTGMRLGGTPGGGGAEEDWGGGTRGGGAGGKEGGG